MYHVLQDLSAFVEGTSYIIAGIALAGFIPFWFFVTRGKHRPR